MRLFLLLLRTQLNQRFGISALRTGLRDDRKKTLRRSAIFVVAVLGFGTLIGMYAWLLALMMPAFHQLGMESVFLGLTLLIAMVLVFFLGMIYLIGTLYFAKDTEFLGSLPVPHRTVFSAKFSQVMLGEIGSCALLLLPAIIVYGTTVGAGISFYLLAIPVLLFAPCIPLALSALLSMLLMRFSALWRHRDLLTIIGSVLLLVLVFVGQMFLNTQLSQYTSQEALMALLSDNSALLQKTVSAFPPSGWAAEGLLGNGGQLALFLFSSSAALALVIWLAGRLYYRGATAQLETASKTYARRGQTVARQRSAIRAMFVREWKNVLRSPVYALNGLTAIVVGPLMLVIPSMIQTGGTVDMQEIVGQLSAGATGPIPLLILCALFLAISLISPAASTCISREGSLFAFLRTLPLSPVRQVIAKLLFGLSVSALAMLTMAVVAVATLGLPVSMVILSLACSFIACIAPLSISLAVDVMRPKLNWNSETEAIKQNINGMLSLAIGWIYVVLFGFLSYLLYRAGLTSTVPLFTVLLTLAIALGVAALYALCRAARRSWRRIEL